MDALEASPQRGPLTVGALAWAVSVRRLSLLLTAVIPFMIGA
jgi:hypothetical protein